MAVIKANMELLARMESSAPLQRPLNASTGPMPVCKS
ncbi:hypothetical protein [Aliamphritea spongicola]